MGGLWHYPSVKAQMAEDESFSMEVKGLDQLIKAMKEKPPTLRIGILGGGSHPSKGRSHSSNAEIGALHEFGSPARGLPARSFLRIPLSENLNSELENSELLDKDTLGQVVKSGTMIPWMKQIGIAAEAVVDDAFETSGDGRWAPWKNPNYHNESGMILVDTGSLRDSIATEVTT